jgi:hypothetical protein
MSRCTIEKFKEAWYEAHARDRARAYMNHDSNPFCSSRGSVMTARTWQQLEDRTWEIRGGSSGYDWHTAALNRCLPWQL